VGYSRVKCHFLYAREIDINVSPTTSYLWNGAFCSLMTVLRLFAADINPRCGQSGVLYLDLEQGCIFSYEHLHVYLSAIRFELYQHVEPVIPEASSCTQSTSACQIAMTRTVGLIGGMSWRTTAVYYQEINQRVNAKLGGIRSPNLIIKSLDYAEVARCITTKDFDAMTELFCSSGCELKAAGAQALVLCANIAHKAADTLQARSGLPVLHIADFTAHEVAKDGHRRVGLLATRAVMEESFYKSRLTDRYGLEIVVPSEAFRTNADKLIFEELSKDSIPREAISLVRSAYSELVEEHGVQCVILGCTEFRLVFGPEEMTVPTYETTALHAKGIADWAMSQ